MAVTFGTPVQTPVFGGSWTGSPYSLSLTGVTTHQPIVLHSFCIAGGGLGSAIALGSSPIADTFSTPYTWTKVGSQTAADGNSIVECWIGTGGAGTSGTITVTGSAGVFYGGVATPCIGANTTLTGLAAVDVIATNTADTTSLALSLVPVASGDGVLAAAVTGIQSQLFNSATGSPWSSPSYLPSTSGNCWAAVSNYSNPTAGATLAQTFGLNGTTFTAGIIIAVLSPPTAPSTTLSTPVNSGFADATQPISFSGVYHPTDSYSQNAYAMRIKVSGGSYQYWNATTNLLQGTIVWNATSTAPLGSFGPTLPANTLTNGNVYNCSLASQDSIANLQGVFPTDSSFTAQLGPIATITSPLGTITQTEPPIVWTRTLGGSASQTAYQVIIETGTYGTVPGSGTRVFTTGVVSSSALTAAVTTALANGSTYRVFLQITQTGPQTSPWAYSTITIAATAPAIPVVTASVVNDATSGLPKVQLTVNTFDNQLTAGQASLESGVTTGWAAGSNTTIAASTTWALAGGYSLALTATAGGAVSATTSTGTSGIPVTVGTIVRAMAWFKSPTTGRTVSVGIAFYNAAGTLLSTTTSNTVTSNTGTAGKQAFVSTTAPTNAAFMALVLNGASLGASEILYTDCMFLGPTVTASSVPYDVLLPTLTPTGSWKLNDSLGAGSALDSVSGNNGVVTPTVTFGQPPSVNGDNAALFDGDSGQILSTYKPGVTSTATMIAFYQTTSNATIVMADTGALGGAQGLTLFMLAGNLSAQLGTSVVTNKQVQDPNDSNDGNWHMATVTYNGTNLVLYRDGVQVGTVAATGTMTSAYDLRIGALTFLTTGIGNWWSGSLAQVSWFQTTLTGTNITNLYNAAPIYGALWSAGGVIGNGSLTIKRSDGVLVRGSGWEGNTAIPSTQTVTVYDVETPPLVAYNYSAMVTATILGAPVTGPAGLSGYVTVTPTKWDIMDPNNIAGGTQIDWSGDSRTWDQPEKQGAFDAFGRSNTIVVHGTLKAQSPSPLQLVFGDDADAAWLKFNALRQQQITLQLRGDMLGDFFYVALGPSRPAVLNRTTDRHTNPSRSLSIVCYPVDRP